MSIAMNPIFSFRTPPPTFFDDPDTYRIFEDLQHQKTLEKIYSLPISDKVVLSPPPGSSLQAHPFHPSEDSKIFTSRKRKLSTENLKEQSETPPSSDKSPSDRSETTPFFSAQQFAISANDLPELPPAGTNFPNLCPSPSKAQSSSSKWDDSQAKRSRRTVDEPDATDEKINFFVSLQMVRKRVRNRRTKKEVVTSNCGWRTHYKQVDMELQCENTEGKVSILAQKTIDPKKECEGKRDTSFTQQHLFSIPITPSLNLSTLSLHLTSYPLPTSENQDIKTQNISLFGDPGRTTSLLHPLRKGNIGLPLNFEKLPDFRLEEISLAVAFATQNSFEVVKFRNGGQSTYNRGTPAYSLRRSKGHSLSLPVAKLINDLYEKLSDEESDRRA